MQAASLKEEEMKILHTADWHLGQTFHGQPLLDDQQVVLDELIRVAKDARVDAVVMAGDVYDRALPPTEAVNLLDEVLQRLVRDVQVPVLLIAGNHDNPARLDFGRRLFETNRLYITGQPGAAVAPIRLEDAWGPVWFAPLPYCEPLLATELSGTRQHTHEEALRWQAGQMLARIPARERKVALSHAFVTGAAVTPESERTLAAGGAEQVSLSCYGAFDYAALGHLHARQHCGGKAAYSGSLMKYSFSEVHQKKGIILAELDKDGQVALEDVPLTAPRELDIVRGSFADLLATPDPAKVDNYLQVTLTDTEPVLDAKNRLEQVYHHVLQIQYGQLAPRPEETEEAGRRGKTDRELFEQFFRDVNGGDMSEKERQVLTATLEELAREGRNA